MSISHWGIVPGAYLGNARNCKVEWQPLDFAAWCRYMYGTENEP